MLVTHAIVTVFAWDKRPQQYDTIEWVVHVEVTGHQSVHHAAVEAFHKAHPFHTEIEHTAIVTSWNESRFDEIANQKVFV